MSLWSRERIRVVLCPRQVALVRIGRNRSSRVLEQRVVCSPPPDPGQAAWQPPLAALEAVLPEFAGRGADAVVVLSNHFARYALTAAKRSVSTTEEERALIRHQFARIYGSCAEQWTYALNGAQQPDEARVACAIDQGLGDSLRAVFEPGRIRLRSIQPYLMAAFNPLRQRLADNAWLALVEPGMLCLARFERGRWQSLKTVRIGDDWLRDLSVQLEREEFLAGCEISDQSGRDPVFVLAPGHPEPDAGQIEQYAIRMLRDHAVRLLRPTVSAEGAVSTEPSYAMALVG